MLRLQSTTDTPPEGVPPRLWEEAETAYYRCGGLTSLANIAEFLRVHCKMEIHESFLREQLELMESDEVRLAKEEQLRQQPPIFHPEQEEKATKKFRKPRSRNVSKTTFRETPRSKSSLEATPFAANLPSASQQQQQGAPRRSSLRQLTSFPRSPSTMAVDERKESLHPVFANLERSIGATSIKDSSLTSPPEGVKRTTSVTPPPEELTFTVVEEPPLKMPHRVARYAVLEDEGVLTLFQLRLLIQRLCKTLQLASDGSAPQKEFILDAMREEDAFISIRDMAEYSDESMSGEEGEETEADETTTTEPTTGGADQAATLKRSSTLLRRTVSQKGLTNFSVVSKDSSLPRQASRKGAEQLPSSGQSQPDGQEEEEQDENVVRKAKVLRQLHRFGLLPELEEIDQSPLLMPSMSGGMGSDSNNTSYSDFAEARNAESRVSFFASGTSFLKAPEAARRKGALPPPPRTEFDRENFLGDFLREGLDETTVYSTTSPVGRPLVPSRRQKRTEANQRKYLTRAMKVTLPDIDPSQATRRMTTSGGAPLGKPRGPIQQQPHPDEEEEEGKRDDAWLMERFTPPSSIASEDLDSNGDIIPRMSEEEMEQLAMLEEQRKRQEQRLDVDLEETAQQLLMLTAACDDDLVGTGGQQRKRKHKAGEGVDSEESSSVEGEQGFHPMATTRTTATTESTNNGDRNLPHPDDLFVIELDPAEKMKQAAQQRYLRKESYAQGLPRPRIELKQALEEYWERRRGKQPKRRTISTQTEAPSFTKLWLGVFKTDKGASTEARKKDGTVGRVLNVAVERRRKAQALKQLRKNQEQLLLLQASATLTNETDGAAKSRTGSSVSSGSTTTPAPTPSQRQSKSNSAVFLDNDSGVGVQQHSNSSSSLRKKSGSTVSENVSGGGNNGKGKKVSIAGTTGTSRTSSSSSLPAVLVAPKGRGSTGSSSQQ